MGDLPNKFHPHKHLQGKVIREAIYLDSLVDDEKLYHEPWLLELGGKCLHLDALSPSTY
jgi:hypothetical protein